MVEGVGDIWLVGLERLKESEMVRDIFVMLVLLVQALSFWGLREATSRLITRLNSMEMVMTTFCGPRAGDELMYMGDGFTCVRRADNNCNEVK